MTIPRYLTKSRFKLAVECPTKLFYTGKAEYPDQSMEDSFLAALAEGGFQVGALAKAYYPGGHDIKALDYETALAETNALLERENVTIFEAAVRYENLFIRIDVLHKEGNLLDLIEVKAKSVEDKKEMIGKRSGKIAPAWKPYLMDVAFQDHVLKKAFPDAVVRSRLMLADKKARTSVDGLNQKFKLVADANGRKGVLTVGDLSPEALGDPVLTKVNVHDHLKLIQNDTYTIGHQSYDFEGYIHALAEAYRADVKIPPRADCGICGKCTFRTTPAEALKGKRSGFKECWKEALAFSDADFDRPSVMEIWNFQKKQEFLRHKKFFMRDLEEIDFDLDKPTQERQWLQVQKTVANDPTPWIDIAGLREAFAAWTWPLHFIDFETSAVAIPFTKGRRPYEVVAFQFSHHVAHEDGRIEHANEYINIEPGVFPNFEFVRRLKAALEQDEGTVFRYATHENTVLNHILRQIEESEDDIPDRIELTDWIRTITQNRDSGWEGSRSMVDLLELVKKHYYQLDMGGSNSIKKVLPAVLNHSTHLQKKYSQPIYNSRNFQNQPWIQRDETGRVKDPYKLLPPIFNDLLQDELERIETADMLADGGAAMTAYARLQFSDVPETVRHATRQALLRYCELDTLAMVMIWEAWSDALNAGSS